MVISFLGPDGSGKSTIINELKKKSLFEKYYYFHLKPLKINESFNNNQYVDDPHKDPVYSKIKSYFKLIYFVFQYNLGWMKNIYKFNKKSSLIIFDRYYDDLLVDNKRYRYGGSISIAKFFRNFIPKPDLYFVLIAEVDVIYQRKKEISIPELERQIIEYKNLTKKNRYIAIYVNRHPSEILSEIIKVIESKIHS